jgi:protein gp37
MRSRGWDPRKVVRSKTTFDAPLRKTRKGEWKIPDGAVVFVCSLSDFFHEDVHPVDRNAALGMMMLRPDVTFLLLTKRPQRMARALNAITSQGSPNDLGLLQVDMGQVSAEFHDVNGRPLVTECHLLDVMDADWPPQHIWLGVTAENQERADERIPQLLSIDWPGKKWVSVEPMLGPVDMERPWGHGVGDLMVDSALRTSHLDWVICGGESGPGARSFDVEWGRSLRDQCQAAGVPFWMKQLGGWPNRREKLEEIPPDLRIRERPSR